VAKSIHFPDVEVEPKLGGRGPEIPPDGRGGGGDNGDGDSYREQPHGPSYRLRYFRIGLGLGVTSIFSIFIALTIAYLLRQSHGHIDTHTGEWVRDWREMAIPPILWLNTAVLILSSFTVELARRAVFHENAVMEEWLGIQPSTRKRSLPWLSISLLLGLCFLGGQVIAWRELVGQGFLLPSNPSNAFFFILTGGHAIHLLGGIVGLLWASLSSSFKLKLQSRQILVDVTAWYWHAMGLLWIYIFVLFHVAH
jgi:cytochrome c oxidase subunit 3